MKATIEPGVWPGAPVELQRDLRISVGLHDDRRRHGLEIDRPALVSSRQEGLMKKRTVAAISVLAVVMLYCAGTAKADVQTQGSEQLGRVWLGVHPLGGAVFFDNESSIYKFDFDALGRIASTGGLTFWLGGELNIGGVSNYALIEPGIVFQMTFEKMIRIPLVPHVRVGVSGGIDNYYGSGVCFTPGAGRFPCNDYSFTAGDFWVKFGGGIHYFIIRQIGLGIDTNFGLGGQFYDQNGVRQSGFRGYFDFLAGAVFTF